MNQYQIAPTQKRSRKICMICDESISSSNTKTVRRNRRDPLLESFQSRNIYVNPTRGFMGEKSQQSCIRQHSPREQNMIITILSHQGQSRHVYSTSLVNKYNVIHVHPTIKFLRDMPPSITLLNSIHYRHVETLLSAPQFECLSTN